jgi:YesN/AraC family two-component response regulator
MKGVGVVGVDLMITDMLMPGINVRELISRMKVVRPGLRVLLISGSDELVKQDDAFLLKPWTIEALSRKVREVLDREPIDPTKS